MKTESELSADDRILIKLLHDKGFSISNISEIFECTEFAVKNILTPKN